jgi:hypothetical protein
VGLHGGTVNITTIVVIIMFIYSSIGSGVDRVVAVVFVVEKISVGSVHLYSILIN